ALRGMVEGAPKVVEDGKELTQQLLVRVLGSIRQLLTRAPLVVLEVCSQPLVTRERGLGFVTRGLQFGVRSLLRHGSGLGIVRGARPGIDDALVPLLRVRHGLVGSLMPR